MIDIGSKLNQRFLLEKELGRGGMGAVYSAHDELLERKVAIKLLAQGNSAEVGQKLRLEAQIAARLLHDFVVRIYDFGEADAISYLVMEQVEGSSYAKRWRNLTLAERLRLLAQVAEALDYAHHQGVIHRDVKPANVLVTGATIPKLSDFGLSLIGGCADQSGVIRGTPHYMSPEQTRGGRLDHRTDLYSLGVMTYESATGGLPFSGSSISIMSQHFSVEPEPARSRNKLVSPELDVLIRSLMAKRPSDRPNSGAVVAQALRHEVERICGRENATTKTTASKGARTNIATLDGPPGVTVPLNNAARSSNVGLTESIRVDAATSAPATDRASASLAIATVGSTGGMTGLIRSPLVRRMLEVVLAEPVLLGAEERYLHGHYLAYLLSGSPRRGLFLRRPLEQRNGDRARLLLGITYAVICGGGEEAVREAASLLDERTDVRSLLSPLVVAKYLACRQNQARRKLFRQARTAIAQSSKYAQKRMLDANGVLNPGLMPQRLENLRLLAPPRDDIDDDLVERWNRVSEAWRNDVKFRNAVLRYGTTKAYRDPASVALWPEVVYPLIERARWHRRIRPKTEMVWDYICGRLRVPVAGVVFDRVLYRSIPTRIFTHFDDEIVLFSDNIRLDSLDSDPFAPGSRDQADQLGMSLTDNRADMTNLACELTAGSDEKSKSLLELADPEPLRFFQGQLHDLWREAVAIQSQPRPAVKMAGHRHVAVGPYKLTVIPSLRGRAAGQIAIQGMSNKQIEISTPPVRTKRSSTQPLVAVWVYKDQSLVIVHLDFVNTERFVLWHAPRGHQLNFDSAADLNHELYTLGMEAPDQIDKVLSRRYKPRHH